LPSADPDRGRPSLQRCGAGRGRRCREGEHPLHHAGHADILVVPDLEAGNLLNKILAFLMNADSAGIVLGARVPITLTSCADSVQGRHASGACSLVGDPDPDPGSDLFFRIGMSASGR
jgi:hypothetical protein